MRRNLHPGTAPVNARGQPEPSGILDGEWLAGWRGYRRLQSPVALPQPGLPWCARRHAQRNRPALRPLCAGTAPSSDFSDPLEPWEYPPPSLRGVLAWLPTTLSPLLPPGVRHTATPRAGARARWVGTLAACWAGTGAACLAGMPQAQHLGCHPAPDDAGTS